MGLVSKPLKWSHTELAQKRPRDRTSRLETIRSWTVIWAGAKRMGGGKRTRERALPNIFGPLQKSFSSALSWIFVQEKQSTDTRGGWKTYRTRGVPKALFGRGVIREVFHPPPFSTPPWRPLTKQKGPWQTTTVNDPGSTSLTSCTEGPSAPKSRIAIRTSKLG